MTSIVEHVIIHIKHYIFISYISLILNNFASWTNAVNQSFIKYSKYVKNLLLRTSLCFFLNLIKPLQ